MYKAFSTDLFRCINLAKAKFLFLNKRFWDHQSQVELRKSGPFCLSSVQFSHSVVSDSLRPHGLQHTRPPCPSPTPGVYSNSCPLSQLLSNHLILCRPLLLLSSIFPSIRVFPVSQVFSSGGQSIGVSASASVLPMKIQD